jgi:hypothetical protein
MWIDLLSFSLHHPRASTKRKRPLCPRESSVNLGWAFKVCNTREVAPMQLLPGDHAREVGYPEVRQFPIMAVERG